MAEEVAGDGAVVRGGLEHERRTARAARLEVEDQVDVLVVGAVVAHLVAGADEADLLAVGDDDLQRVLRLATFGLEGPERLDDGGHAVAVVGCTERGAVGDLLMAVLVRLNRGRVVVGHERHGALGLPWDVDDDRVSRRVLKRRLLHGGQVIEDPLVRRVAEIEHRVGVHGGGVAEVGEHADDVVARPIVRLAAQDTVGLVGEAVDGDHGALGGELGRVGGGWCGGGQDEDAQARHQTQQGGDRGQQAPGETGRGETAISHGVSFQDVKRW